MWTNPIDTLKSSTPAVPAKKSPTKTSGKQWLKRPPSHHKNVFASQIEEQIKAPYAHKTAKYVVEENDSVLKATRSKPRFNDIGEIGPPIMIRSSYNDSKDDLLTSSKSHSTLKDLATSQTTVSDISAQGAQAQLANDPFLRKTKFKTLRSDTSQLHSSLKMNRKFLGTKKASIS